MMLALTVPIVCWGVQASPVHPSDLLRAARAPLVASVASLGLSLPLLWIGTSWAALPRLIAEGGVFALTYAFILLFGMQHRDLYFGIVRQLAFRSGSQGASM